MKGKHSKVLGYSLIVMLVLSAVFIVAPASAVNENVRLAVQNSSDGTNLFNFTTSDKSVGDTFVVDIMISDVVYLAGWQANITWDGTLLEKVGIVLGDPNIFTGHAGTPVGPNWGTESVIYGFVLTTTDDYANSTGWSRLCQLTLRIIKGVSQLEPDVTCDLTIANVGTDTLLVNKDGYKITPHEVINAVYEYHWIAPSFKPTYYLKPAVNKPLKKGDVVPVEVWIRNVAAAWNIISLQFSIMWNYTFIVPIQVGGYYYANGSFLEASEYAPGGVLYASDINVHDRPVPWTPIPDGYNYSSIALTLMPDPVGPPYFHEPWPETGGASAKVATLYFEAIYDTLSPVEDWTWIEFIGEDCFDLNAYGINIGFAGLEPAHYRAPMRILGLSIDLYTQYNTPYGGQGPDMPSDMFGPQQQVELYALVTYNEYPVQQKLVGFEIRHNGYDFWREATTNGFGVAHVSFRLPWPCVNPVSEIFGKWYVVATVEVAEQVAEDTLGFWVWWKVQVTSVEPKGTETPVNFVQSKQGGMMNFTVTYITYSMQKINATITVTVYDELGFFIGSKYIDAINIGQGEYVYYNYTACETPPFKEYTWDLSIPLPSNAVIGKGIVFGNAFDKFPWLGGTPYCPEVTNTIDFYIKKP
jgi:hypothetical protein